MKKGIMALKRSKIRRSFFLGFMFLSACFLGTVSRQVSAEDAKATGANSTDVAVQAVNGPANAALPPKALPVFASKSGSPKWLEGWYEGGDGYTAASEASQTAHKPMAVYVSVGWCPYCRKFEKEILSSPAVREYLKDKIMVRINPEASRKENGLAFQYQVTGFPSFYVHTSQADKVVRLYTGGTPQEFIEQFEQASK